MNTQEDELQSFRARNEQIKKMCKTQAYQSHALKDHNFLKPTLASKFNSKTSKTSFTSKTNLKNLTSRTLHSEVVERLYNKEKERKTNLEKIKKNYESQLLSKNQAKPIISRKSQEIAKKIKYTNLYSSQKKSLTPDITIQFQTQNEQKKKKNITKEKVNEFAREQSQWLKRKNELLLKHKLEQESKDQDECTYQPQISRRSYSFRTNCHSTYTQV